jgi:alpha-glucosidase (family GH31 glycosyl hydrolase)
MQDSISGYHGFSYLNDTLLIFIENLSIRITAYQPNILQIKSILTERVAEKSHSVVPSKSVCRTFFEQKNNFLYFSTDSIFLSIDTNNLQFSFIYQEDTILKAPKIYSSKTVDLLRFNYTPDEQLYGTGARAIPLNRTNYALDVYNQARYGYGYGEQNLNIALPALSSSNNYTLYIDNYSKGKWSLGKDNPLEYTYLFTNGESDVYLMVGQNHAALSHYFSELTGYQPLPPIWALGYIQSKYGYESETETKNIVNELQSNGYPLDAIVLDLYWFGNTNTMGNMNWDKTRFPNAGKMMNDLRAKGVKTILISETYFTQQSTNYNYAASNGFFAKNEHNQAWVIGDFWAGSASLLDIFNPQAQTWFWQFYKNRTLEGAEAWWTDLGEPENHPSEMIHYGNKQATQIHNIYALEWEKMLYENWKTDFPEKRFFNLSRSGFSGMQRYSTFPWSGDIQRSFDGLKAQVPIMLGIGLHGIAYMHSDIGGFTGGGQNNELFVRWVQMGIFSPVFRIHGTGIETHPTAYSDYTQDITLKYIQWRYELLPYNYTLAYENSTKGTPLARTMDFYEPQNSFLQNVNDQYFWGEHFIVAPILQSGISSRIVKIPAGKWINWQSLESYSGPASKSIAAPLSDIPVLVKAGSIIPLVKNLSSTDDYTSQNLVLKYFRDETVEYSYFTLFDDDKKSTSTLANKQFELLHFEARQNAQRIVLNFSKSGSSYSQAPSERCILLEIPRNELFPDSVYFQGNKISPVTNFSEMENNPLSYYHDVAKKTLYVQISWTGEIVELSIAGFRAPTPSGIKPIEASFKLYPNPASSYIILETTQTSKAEILSSSGKVLKTINIESKSSSEWIDVSDLASGVYVLRIFSKQLIYNKKLVIQK